MALAILTYSQGLTNEHLFRFETGSNLFFRFLIGGKEVYNDQGFKRMNSVSHRSSLQAMSASQMGRGILTVPRKLFDRRHQYIQLETYKSPSLDGASFSSILRVNAPFESTELAPMHMLSTSSSMQNQTDLSPQPIHVDQVPFSYQESKMSSAMFLSALVSALPKVLPAVTNILPMLTGGGKTGGKAGIGGQVMGLLDQLGPLLSGLTGGDGEEGGTDLVSTIGSLVAGLLGGGQAEAQSTGIGYIASPPAYEPAYSYEARRRKKKRKRNTTKAKRRQTPRNRTSKSSIPSFTDSLLDIGKQIATDVSTQVGNDLVNKLTGTGPSPTIQPEDLEGLLEVLQQNGVDTGHLSPEALQTLMTAMANHLGTVLPGSNSEAIAQSLRLASKPPAPGLATSFTQSMTRSNGPFVSLGRQMAIIPPDNMDYLPTDKVKLAFEDMERISLAGKPKVFFSQNHKMVIPLRVDTPKAISKAIVKYSLTRASDGQQVVKGMLRLRQVESGRLAEAATFQPEQLSRLESQKPYILSIRLIWKNRQGRRLGTSLTQVIHLIDEGYTFDHMTPEGNLIPLNNVKQFRAYWHKIWGATLEQHTQSLALDCKYYYVFESTRSTLAKMETLSKLEAVDARKMNGKMKSGMILSPEALSQLLPQISQQPSLSPEVLSALDTPEFSNQAGLVGRTKLTLEGIPGDSMALWVYPEMQLHQLLLKQATGFNENGRVTQWTDQRASLPIPHTIHFIGTMLES